MRTLDPLASDELSDERAVLVRGLASPWPTGAGLRLPGEEVRFEAGPREWVPPGRGLAAVVVALLGLTLAASWLRPAPYVPLVPALLLVLEAARCAWWRRARYVVTTARVLALGGALRPRVLVDLSRSRVRLDVAAAPAVLSSDEGAVALVGLDAAEVAALAAALGAAPAARGLQRARLRRADLPLAPQRA